jgi:hypothetical protein
MSLNAKRALVLFKLEVAYGTDPLATPLANAMLANVTSPKPVVTEFVDRTNMQAYLGHKGSVQVATHSEFEMEVELAGSGTAGIAPSWGPLMRACGFAETVTEDESVVYNPVSEGFESGSFIYNLDGKEHKLMGCRGTVNLDMQAKTIPKLKFKFTGTTADIADVAFPSGADFSKFIAPVGVNKQNTSMTLFGTTVGVYGVNFDIANTTPYVNVINQEEVKMTDRAAVGSVSFQNTLVAQKDWYGLVKAGTLSVLKLIHGKTPGNIITIDAPAVQLTEPSEADQDGVATISASMKIKPSVGNDELVVTVT